MRSTLRVVLLVVAVLALNSCSGPSYTWFVNNSGERVRILLAEADPFGGFNSANASPWFWPFRTVPSLRHGAGFRLTTYCYGCMGRWRFEVELGSNGCRLTFAVPEPPIDAYARDDWKVFAAYRSGALQLERDRELYRVPAYGEEPASITMIAQPEGYPIASTRSNC